MNNRVIGIVGNGSVELLADILSYKAKINYWIGADRGAYILKECVLPLHYAVGDFDSVSEIEFKEVEAYASQLELHPAAKDKTDLELALLRAFSMKPEAIVLFGVTGGRKDHELINIQLLHSIIKRGIRGILIDKYNYIEMMFPGTYDIQYDENYPNISFIPFSEEVEGLTLAGFHYPLENEMITWGSTRTISNKLSSESGTFSYERGILLLVKSGDSKL